MNCRIAHQMISQRLDGPLPADDALALHDHLQTCRTCQRFERLLANGMNEIERLPNPPGSERVRADVWRYVVSSGFDERPAGAGWWLRQLSAFAAGAAALAAVAALTVVLLHGLGAPTPLWEPEQPAAAPAAGAVATPQIATLRASPVPNGVAATPAPAEVRPPSHTATSIPTPIPSPTPMPVDAETARQVVESYFAAINRRDFATAYSLFGPEMAAEQSYVDFQQGFATTDHDEITILSTQPTDIPGRQSVSVEVVAYQTDGSIRRYSGAYEVASSGGVPRIVGAKVIETTPAETSSPGALPECLPGDFAVSVSAEERPDAVALWVVAFAGQSQCALPDTLSVTIRDAQDGALPVEGTGDALPLPHLPMPAASGFGLLWENWCGTAAPVSVRVTAGGSSWVADNVTPPDCSAPDRPSLTKRIEPVVQEGTIVRTSVSDRSVAIQQDDGTVATLALKDSTPILDQALNALGLGDLQPGARVVAAGELSATDGVLHPVAVVVVR